MRLFHYPPQPPVTDDKAFGVAPHSDYGMTRKLCAKNVRGGYSRRVSSQWRR